MSRNYYKDPDISFPYGTPKNPRRCGVDGLMGDNVRWSDSMGCNPCEIPNMMKHFPGSEYNSEGQLKIKNRTHKKKEMRRRGYVEL